MPWSQGENIMAKGMEVTHAEFVDGLVVATIKVTGAKISTGETANDTSMVVSYDLRVNLPLKDVLEMAGTGWKIQLANIRKQGIEAIGRLQGATVDVSDIPAMVAVKGTKKTAIETIMEVLKLSREQAELVMKDPSLINIVASATE